MMSRDTRPNLLFDRVACIEAVCHSGSLYEPSLFILFEGLPICFIAEIDTGARCNTHVQCNTRAARPSCTCTNYVDSHRGLAVITSEY